MKAVIKGDKPKAAAKRKAKAPAVADSTTD
jgi:hypothetical protein